MKEKKIQQFTCKGENAKKTLTQLVQLLNVDLTLIENLSIQGTSYQEGNKQVNKFNIFLEDTNLQITQTAILN